MHTHIHTWVQPPAAPACAVLPPRPAQQGYAVTGKGKFKTWSTAYKAAYPCIYHADSYGSLSIAYAIHSVSMTANLGQAAGSKLHLSPEPGQAYVAYLPVNRISFETRAIGHVCVAHLQLVTSQPGRRGVKREKRRKMCIIF
eukprot:1134223-Pelagomonas_calceolata.AAC.3